MVELEMPFLVQLNALWRVPLILIWTAGMATVSMALSLVDNTGRSQHWCARLWSCFILSVSRVRVEVEGLQRIDPTRSYIFVANHLSMFDHWAFLALLPLQFRFAAKASLFRLPFLGWHLRRSGSIPVDRHQHRQTLRAFREAAGRCKKGISFLIYPEGGRSLGETVAPFRRGSLLLAHYAAVPIVPVTLIDAHRRLRRGSVLIRPGSMRMIIHPPIGYHEYKHLDLHALSARVRDIIRDRYHQVS